jgi:hypothetical protein
MDKYTKFILTVIAVGVIGLNIHFFKDEIISPAHAVESHYHTVDDIENFHKIVRRLVDKWQD